MPHPGDPPTPAIPQEMPTPVEPEMDPTVEPEVPSYDPPAQPGDWRPHD
jgi:hypothetical protein